MGARDDKAIARVTAQHSTKTYTLRFSILSAGSKMQDSKKRSSRNPTMPRDSLEPACSKGRMVGDEGPIGSVIIV